MFERLGQVPDEHIVWRSTGPKGHVDGAVSFHELPPDLTRVLLVLEYHPAGLFERTGNLWLAQGRRRTTVTLTEAEAGQYAGRYQDPGLIATFTPSNGGLETSVEPLNQKNG